MIQESPSKFFLTVSGILKPRHAAHRNRTRTGGCLIRLGGKSTGGSWPLWKRQNSEEDLVERSRVRYACGKQPSEGEVTHELPTLYDFPSSRLLSLQHIVTEQTYFFCTFSLFHPFLIFPLLKTM
jgi:hypothetical protein